jgi:hypothetical protein
MIWAVDWLAVFGTLSLRPCTSADSPAKIWSLIVTGTLDDPPMLKRTPCTQSFRLGEPPSTTSWSVCRRRLALYRNR